jgi:hypothetical protein
MVLPICGCLFVKKIQNIDSACFSEITYTNFDNPSRSPIQGACTGFPIAAVTLKVVLIAACDPEIDPKAGYECTLAKIDQ